jgi:outer membrane lipoprotein-sorting protein
MTYDLKRAILLLPLTAAALLSGCVWQSTYDDLQAQYQQAQQQNAALTTQLADAKTQILPASGSDQVHRQQ